jgi:hypothetical protein
VSQPAYQALTEPTHLGSNGTNYFLTTDGGDQEVLSVDGDGVQDGTEITITNNGPDDITLRDGQGDAGNKLFLPGAQDRILMATGKPYWMFRNENGPRGNGWYDGEDPA